MENNKNIKPIVMESYKKIAVESSNCCGDNISKSIGYSEEELETVPKDSNLGLGCGNPQLIANICEGETVLDLGSGAGFDCFLASKKVGDSGQVIGVDMTFEMVTKARNNAYENNYNNVDFRLGEIENLPVADNTVDVIISNCVINLSPNKQRVYDEAYRVLKEGGRLAISDIVLMKDLTDEMKEDEKLYCG
jgi:SAM-dependent methyltransferase